MKDDQYATVRRTRIIQLLKEGTPYAAIAESQGCSVSLVSKIAVNAGARRQPKHEKAKA